MNKRRRPIPMIVLQISFFVDFLLVHSFIQYMIPSMLCRSNRMQTSRQKQDTVSIDAKGPSIIRHIHGTLGCIIPEGRVGFPPSWNLMFAIRYFAKWDTFRALKSWVVVTVHWFVPHWFIRRRGTRVAVKPQRGAAQKAKQHDCSHRRASARLLSPRFALCIIQNFMKQRLAFMARHSLFLRMATLISSILGMGRCALFSLILRLSFVHTLENNVKENCWLNKN